MLKFFFNGSPNPTKVALFLEEAGLAYEPLAVDTRAGDSSSSRRSSPSIRTARCPRSWTATSRCSTATPSCSYLAEKTGKFLPPASARGETAVAG